MDRQIRWLAGGVGAEPQDSEGEEMKKASKGQARKRSGFQDFLSQESKGTVVVVVVQ